jgi:hypothetical protein
LVLRIQAVCRQTLLGPVEEEFTREVLVAEEALLTAKTQTVLAVAVAVAVTRVVPERLAEKVETAETASCTF